MMHKAWSSIEEVPYCLFKVTHQISRSHGTKNHHFWPELSVSGQYHEFELTDSW